MQEYGVVLVTPTTERISEIVSMVVSDYQSKKVTGESLEMIKAECLAIIKAESSIKFNSAP